MKISCTIARTWGNVSRGPSRGRIRSFCRNAYATAVMTAWCCQPGYDRPSKWSKPSSVFRSWYCCSIAHRPADHPRGGDLMVPRSA